MLAVFASGSNIYSVVFLGKCDILKMCETTDDISCVICQIKLLWCHDRHYKTVFIDYDGLPITGMILMLDICGVAL